MKLHKLDYLIISGDVCDRPIKEHYEVALQFCRKLISEFKLNIANVIIVAGNHDCNRDISEKSYDEIEKMFREEERKKRFETYNKCFYYPLFNRDFSMEHEWQIERCKDDNNKIYIAGFNSSYQIDHKEKKEIGNLYENDPKR